MPTLDSVRNAGALGNWQREFRSAGGGVGGDRELIARLDWMGVLIWNSAIRTVRAGGGWLWRQNLGTEPN